MAGNGPGFVVDPDELDAHKKKLDALSGRVNMALSAAGETMHPEAFGLVGIPLAGICAITQTIASSSLSSASEASIDHVKRVQTWKEHKEMDEDEFQRLFKVED
ncbi:hypothetical protein [Amycolatopsis sp. NPDC059657]|uniref:hypothetical protein n=1 Tax=Amycolatopsis sp. NPDC059657 TaxID=3346899 RepID=UPI003670B9AA